MATANITGPSVNASITYSTGKDVDGVPIQYGTQVVGRRAESAVAEGEVVELIVSASNAPVSVKKADANAEGYEVYGVALESAAAGEIVRVATDIGWCRATTDVAADALVAVSATAGQVDDGAGADELGRCGKAIGASIANFFGTTRGVLVRFVR